MTPQAPEAGKEAAQFRKKQTVDRMDTNKIVEDYLKQPYARVLIPEVDGTFRGEILEFPGCIAVGDTREQTLDSLEDVAAGWLTAALANGQSVPTPTEVQIVTLKKHPPGLVKSGQADSSIAPDSSIREGDFFSANIGGREHHFCAASVARASENGGQTSQSNGVALFRAVKQLFDTSDRHPSPDHDGDVIAEIQKRHDDEPVEQMQSYLSAKAAYNDRATLLRLLAARALPDPNYKSGTLHPGGIPVVICVSCNDWDMDIEHIKHKPGCGHKRFASRRLEGMMEEER